MKWFFESKFSFFEMACLWIIMYLMTHEYINGIGVASMVILGAALSIIGKITTGVKE